ncbi:hypothetical protein B5X24_HaOG201004 [Helicoverpa armigera]|nr:hypothetical protein B5X24_HaOG201004 [Helicoverpa armigera]
MLAYFKKKPKSKVNDVIIKTLPTVQYKEVLLNNVIEKDLQSVLKPLDLMQRLFICAKYCIQDNFITSNSRSYNILGITLAITLRSLLFYNLLRIVSSEDQNNYVLAFSNIFDDVFFSIGFILNYYSNIIQCNNHVLLVLKIQEVHRILRVNGKQLKCLIIINWVYVIVLNVVYILGALFYCLIVSFARILDPVSNYCSIAFDINIVYTAFVMSLLRKTLSIWIEDIRTSKHVAIESYWTVMFDVYSNILEAFKIFEK